jgi:hypothetical protein
MTIQKIGVLYTDDGIAEIGSEKSARSVMRLLWTAAGLLGSGAVSAVGMMLLARGLLPGVSARTAAPIVILVQWQLFALTCAKLGIDQLVFAKVSRHPNLRISLERHLYSRALPISVLCGIALFRLFPAAAAVLIALSAVLDVYAVAKMSELGAKRHFHAVSLANLLNYPVFLGLLALWHRVTLPSTVTAAALFAISSLTRFVYVFAVSQRTERGAVLGRISASPAMGMQQALNFLQFRGDQLILPLFAAGSMNARGVVASLPAYVFLARFPELVSAVLVTLAPLYLPTAYSRLRANAPARSRTLELGALMVVGSGLVVFVSALVLAPRVPLSLCLAFAISASLALPANYITYALLREDLLQVLIGRLLVAVLAGACLVGVALLARSITTLAYAPGLALAVFIAAASLRASRSDTSVNVQA